jgi:hypothetical protein
MVRTAFDGAPELILPVVREAVDYLPTLQQPALLVLNPEDALIVRGSIGHELEKTAGASSKTATSRAAAAASTPPATRSTPRSPRAGSAWRMRWAATWSGWADMDAGRTATPRAGSPT